MASLDPFTATLLQLLSGAPQMMRSREAARVAPSSAMPEPEPATLPQGSFAPQREPMPAPQPEITQGPLAQLLGPDVSRFMRTAGAGMANIRGNSYGDPFITAAQGFGGAQEYAGSQDAAAQQAAAAAEKLAYHRSQDAATTERTAAKDAADLKLRQMAETRQQQNAEIANKKSLLEIRRLARGAGVTVDQYLRARAQAQKDADDLDVDEDQRDDFIDKRTDDLLGKAGVEQGISKKPGLSDGSGDVIADGPEGPLVLRNGEWVPLE